MDSDDGHARSSPSGSLAILGDQFLGPVVWADWFPEGVVVDLRGQRLGGSEPGQVRQLLSDVEPRILLVAVSAAPGAAGIIDLRSVERTVNAVEGLQIRLREAFPDAELVVQSIPPALALDAAQIKDMNRHIRQFCAVVDATFLDLWPEFAQSDGAMKPNHTADDGMLSPSGFEAWMRVADQLRCFSAIGRPSPSRGSIPAAHA